MAPINDLLVRTMIVRQINNLWACAPTCLAHRRKAYHALDSPSAEPVKRLIIVADDRDVVGQRVTKSKIDGFLDGVCILVLIHQHMGKRRTHISTALQECISLSGVKKLAKVPEQMGEVAGIGPREFLFKNLVGFMKRLPRSSCQL